MEFAVHAAHPPSAPACGVRAAGAHLALISARMRSHTSSPAARSPARLPTPALMRNCPDGRQGVRGLPRRGHVQLHGLDGDPRRGLLRGGLHRPVAHRRGPQRAGASLPSVVRVLLVCSWCLRPSFECMVGCSVCRFVCAYWRPAGAKHATWPHAVRRHSRSRWTSA